MINPYRAGLLNRYSKYKDTKDPCPVFDGSSWHLFGSAGSVQEENWGILHATASYPRGPWRELPTVQTLGLSGNHIAAPGVIYEDGVFHMFVQTEFMATGGSVEYLTSENGGIFFRENTALVSLPATTEAGVYDPHPAVIKGQKYLVYAGMPEGALNGRTIIHPDIYLAKSASGTWAGPWTRLGKILGHSNISWHHNQPDQPGYEWGIEGPQILELPSGHILLNATCFLPVGEFGTRQRVFFAFAQQPNGPYISLGPVLDPAFDDWGSGENGHATAILEGGDLKLFYQARGLLKGNNRKANSWRYGLAVFNVNDLQRESFVFSS